ncbi:MAG: DUF58 domain-containing protein [Candidatus Gracilibacteria bacterium]|nr:DUF58 domain-containing protein [Candidatus Gracilibacteria bacterium]
MNINKKIKTLEFKLSKILNGGLFGAYKSKFHGSGMEFAEHKQYIFGDSLRDIDWKTYNKTDKLYVKKYEEERDLNVLFALDNTKSMEFGSQDYTKKDILQEVFYSLAMSAFLNNDNVGALIFDENNIDFIEHKKSKENIFKIFQKLESVNNTKGGNTENKITKIENLLNQLYKRNIKNNLIFVLTDDTEIKNEKILKLVGKENELVYINILDDFEYNLPNLGGNMSFSLGNNFLNIDLSNEKKIQEYRKNINYKFKYLNELFRKNKVGYIKLTTNSDIFKDLLLYFYKIKN